MLEKHRRKAGFLALAFTILVLFVAFTKMDYEVFRGSYWGYVFWFNISIIVAGFCLALAFFMDGNIRLGTTTSGAFVILVVSGFEDVLFFLLNVGAFPPLYRNWEWHIFFSIFRVWNTVLHLVWAGIWLGFVLPFWCWGVYQVHFTRRS